MVPLNGLRRAINVTYRKLRLVQGFSHINLMPPKRRCVSLPHPPIVSTDPPYYDNIGYADLSDFFYIWLRRGRFEGNSPNHVISTNYGDSKNEDLESLTVSASVYIEHNGSRGARS